jgi:hypothetical protein
MVHTAPSLKPTITSEYEMVPLSLLQVINRYNNHTPFLETQQWFLYTYRVNHMRSNKLLKIKEQFK